MEMKRDSNVPYILIQIMSAFVINFVLYIFLALTDYQGGIDGFLGMIFIQPIYGFIVSYLMTVSCLIIGLPIRLISRVKDFFNRYCFIFILIFIVGIVLYSLSFTNTFSSTIEIDECEYHKSVFQPNLKLLAIGWFLVSFSVLHFDYTVFLKKKNSF